MLRAGLRELPQPRSEQRAAKKNHREVNQQSSEWAHEESLETFLGKGTART
jgi:hypothetical protein